MTYSITHKVRLHNGVEMPQFGLGVYKVEDGKEVVDTVKAALDLGYRSIDTAALYGSFSSRQKFGIRIRGMNRPLLHLRRA